MNNPAIAQRELLRQYYMVTEAEEMLGIVSSDESARVLDLNTTLHLLCHTGTHQSVYPPFQHSSACLSFFL